MNNYMKTIISGLKQWVSSQKSDWNQNDSSTANFIKNRPFYSEEKERVLFSSDSLSSQEFTLPQPLVEGATYTVIFNGVTYQCLAREYDGYIMIGNNAIYEYDNGVETDTGEPFAIEYEVNSTNAYLYTDDTITEAPSVSISGTVEVVHQIDKKYVPIPELANVAFSGDYWDLENTPYIPWDVVQYNETQYLNDDQKLTARNNIGAASASDVSNLSTLVGDTAVSTQIENATDECVTGMSVSGKVITYTKGDGSTGTITTQDTTYNIANGESTGSLRGTGAASETSTYKLGEYAFAFGNGTEASGYGAVAFGNNSTTASGISSFATGNKATASGDFSHAEGRTTTASGMQSHAEGFETTASGNISHVEGYGTIAASSHQHVQGKFNIEDSANKYAHVIGNGAGDGDYRSNAHTLDWNGVGWFKGGLKVGGTSQDDAAAVEVALKSDLESINITADSVLSSTSTNPVQNKVVNAAITNLNTLVGDTAVSTQINNALVAITTAKIDEICNASIYAASEVEF